MGRCEISKRLVGQSERLLFSKWVKEDLDFAISLWADFDTTKYIADNGFYSEEEILDKLNQQIENDANHNVQSWKIYKDENCDFIGCAGVHPKDIDGTTYYFAEVHLKSDFFGNGYGFEAISKVVEFVKNIGVENIYIELDENNIYANSLFKKLKASVKKANEFEGCVYKFI